MREFKKLNLPVMEARIRNGLRGQEIFDVLDTRLGQPIGSGVVGTGQLVLGVVVPTPFLKFLPVLRPSVTPDGDGESKLKKD